MKAAIFGVFLIISVCVFNGAFAATGETDRLKGRVGIGFVIIGSRSADKIDDLEAAPEKQYETLPMIFPDISYDAGGQGGLKLYFDPEPPLAEAGDYVIKLGVVYPIKEFAVLDISAFYNPFAEAWKDPYLTGRDREKTDVSKYGVKLALNRIMGTGLNVNLVYLYEDVTDDVSGQLQPDLARDGGIYALNTDYSVPISRSCEIRPGLGFRRGTFDGESSSFSKYKAGLEMRYTVGKTMLLPELFYTRSDYDKVDPIFNRRRSKNGCGIGLKVNYMHPFGWKKWSVQALVSYSRGDGNISFYDTDTTEMGAFLSYHF